MKKKQELNEKKKQELNEKENNLTISKIKINDLEYQNELLKRTIDDLLRPIDFKKKKLIQ